MRLILATNAKLLGPLVVLGCALAINSNWVMQRTLEMGGDEFEYDSLARRIVAGQGVTLSTGEPTAYRTPGFPLILGGIYIVVNGDIGLARLILVFLTSLTALIIYYTCLKAFDDFAIALTGGIGWAMMATTIHLSGLLYGETSAGLLFTASILLSLVSKKCESNIYAVLAGLMAGFAILTRGYLLFAIMGPFFWLLLWKKRLAFVFLLFAALLPGIWVLRNATVLHAITLSTQTSRELWSGNNAWTRGAWSGDWLKPDPEQIQYLRERYPEFEKMDEVGRSRIFASEFVNEVTNHPKRIAWLVPRKIAIYLSPSSYLGDDWIYAALLPFSLIGMLWMWNNKEARHLLWLIGFPIIGVMLICMLTFGDSRFRHPVNPSVAIFSAIGLKNGIGYFLSKLKLQMRLSSYLNGTKSE